MKTIWVAVLVLAGCMTPVMHFGEGKTAKQAQHDTLQRNFFPSQLSTEGSWAGEIRTAKLRVYADDAYRAQNLDWRDAFEEGLEYANAVLGPKFGVRLVPEYREWTHHAPGASLAEHLEELRQLDAGDHALAVVGLTSSLSLVSATFDQLGVATLNGQHMIVRGYADVEERKAFTSSFPDLPEAERQQALIARRHHKVAALLLHELGHNLGADHEVEEDTLMSARYSVHASGFSAQAYATIQRTLDQRLGRSPVDSGVQTASAAAPASIAETVKSQRRKLYVHITANSVLVEGRPLDAEALDAAFSTRAEQDRETEVVIAKERDVPRARVVEVIDRAKAQGLRNFSLQ